jgi:hypothetical protein
MWIGKMIAWDFGKATIENFWKTNRRSTQGIRTASCARVAQGYQLPVPVFGTGN